MNKNLYLLILLNYFFALDITSSNEYLVTNFNESKETIYNDLVVTGDEPGYIPAYWGSYLIRECFCSRDICHQAEAGHLLGLDLENYSMLKTFASNAPESNEYWPKWSYDFYGEPYFMDADFKELPAPFEIVEKIYEQYLWTGDENWIWNDTLFTYCENTVTHFVSIHDENENGIVETHTELATYWEQEQDDFIEAGDSFANQYRAVIAFAGILEARGEIIESNNFYELAENLRNQFENDWYDDSVERYIRGFDEFGNYKTDFGHENSFFMPMKQITDLDYRTFNYIDFCHKSVAFPYGDNYTQWDYNSGINIEAKTYLPQMGYFNNKISVGWHWLKNIMDSNHSYPEVSFLIIGNIITGMMGISANAPNNLITSLSKLNYEVDWIQIDDIPIGENYVTIRHDGQLQSTFINNSGGNIFWEAQFFGNYDFLLLNGQTVQADQKNVNGSIVTYKKLNVNVGETIIINTPYFVPDGEVFLSDLLWETANCQINEVKRDVTSQGFAQTIDGVVYEKGIGVQGNSEVIYDLNSQYYRFTSDIGFDDSKTQSSAFFEVIGDGIELFNSGELYPEDELMTIDLNIENIDQLILKTTSSNEWDGILNWGNARVNTNESPILSIQFFELLYDDDNNQEFDPGESASIVLLLQNQGINIDEVFLATSINSANSDFVYIENDLISIGEIVFGQVIEVPININLSYDIERGSELVFSFELFNDEYSVDFSKSFFVPAPNLQLEIESINDGNNNIPEPGESFWITINASNVGNYPSDSLFVNCSAIDENSEFVFIDNPNIIISSGLSGNSEVDIEFNISISENLERGENITLFFNITDNQFDASYTQSYIMPYPEIVFKYNGFINDSNGDGVLQNGESANAMLEIINYGDGQTENAILSSYAIGENSEFIEILNSEINLGNIYPNDNILELVSFQISNDGNENMIFNLVFSLSDGIDVFEFQQTIGIDVLWLSDAQWSNAETGWGDLNRDLSCIGNVITLNNIEYQKGIGVHANSEIVIDLNSQFSYFVTDIGIDDEVSNGAGSVEFQILFDGIEVYNSGIMDSDSPTQSINLDVSYVEELKLIVDESTFGISSDHADWAGAKLLILCSSGDLNNDNMVNILDVIITVDCIIGIVLDDICNCANLNGDNFINILDVIIIVDIILNN